MERAIWIVHGDAQARTALARAAGPSALAGPPQLDAFASAPPPGVVVLHVPLAAGEALAFAHAAAARHPHASWLLIGEPGRARDWLHAGFAGLRFEEIPWPGEPRALQQAIQRALAGPAPPLSARRLRDALVAKVARTLGDLAILEPALDASGHLAITGERGTGKLLLARTLHALWDAAGGEGRAGFLLLTGERSVPASELASRLEAAASDGAERLVVCVEDPAAFAPAVQRELASWVELGAPGAALGPTHLLWVFLRPESFGAVAPLDGALAELCDSPALRIPPLRERPGAALRLAEQWLREWYEAKHAPARALSPVAREAIDADPWPGNARELEAALRRAVATPGAGPIEAGDLGVPSPPGFAALGEATRLAAEAVPTAGDAREFASVIEELEAARADEAAGEDFETTRATTAAAPGEETAPQARAAAAVDAPPAPATPAPTEAAHAEPTPAPASARDGEALAAPRPDLRAFARATARELAPALEALRSSAHDEAAAVVVRRLARLEEFAALEADASARCEVAPLLAALLGERRDELLAKRILVLRELESDDTRANANEPALRFALAAVLDTLLEAAPIRTDLYVSARATTADDARPVVRAELRMRSARPPDVALDLALARDLLTRLGATLTLETSSEESRAAIELPR